MFEKLCRVTLKVQKLGREIVVGANQLFGREGVKSVSGRNAGDDLHFACSVQGFSNYLCIHYLCLRYLWW